MKKKIPKKHKPVTNYWLEYYVNDIHCSLCGNSGFIDTRRRATLLSGKDVGRLNWCICPNGQAFRKKSKNDIPTELERPPQPCSYLPPGKMEWSEMLEADLLKMHDIK